MANPQPQGFLATPPSGNGSGVLVLHAWWGLNETIKAFCHRLADAGFTAFAPDLYHGKIATTIPEAETLGKVVDENHLQTEAEVDEATKFLAELTRPAGTSLAVIAFSLGDYYALQQSAAGPEHISSVILYYGGGSGIDFSTSRAAYLGHFAEHDPYMSVEEVDELEEALKKADRPVTFHRYPGTGHWFAEPDRTDAYNEAAANLAWDRTLAFLKQS